GVVVNDFLVEHFNGIVDFNFTAKVEKEFDEIAQGMKEWTAMLHSFYGPFHQEVETTTKHADRATNERELGEEPGNGKRVSVRIMRFGTKIRNRVSDYEE